MKTNDEALPADQRTAVVTANEMTLVSAEAEAVVAFAISDSASATKTVSKKKCMYRSAELSAWFDWRFCPRWSYFYKSWKGCDNQKETALYTCVGS
jgi:hypothetical protein